MCIRDRNKEALIFHAVASPYRSRSHFDAQNIVENGGSQAYQYRSGWINRLVESQSANAISVSKQSPYIAKGVSDIPSWFPKKNIKNLDPFLEKLEVLYKKDRHFADEFEQALKIEELAQKSMMSDDSSSKGTAGSAKLISLLESVSKIITSKQEKVNVTFIDISGWDTHASQGKENGQLASKFKNVDNALSLLPDLMGKEWKNTSVLITTEFGRTVRPNGTGGTDHGTASAAMLLGGNVKGGRVISKWPNLSAKDLYQNRDLKPTMDMRSLFKTVLNQHLGVSRSILNQKVFPNSSKAVYLKGLY